MVHTPFCQFKILCFRLPLVASKLTFTEELHHIIGRVGKKHSRNYTLQIIHTDLGIIIIPSVPERIHICEVRGIVGNVRAFFILYYILQALSILGSIKEPRRSPIRDWGGGVFLSVCSCLIILTILLVLVYFVLLSRTISFASKLRNRYVTNNRGETLYPIH